MTEQPFDNAFHQKPPVNYERYFVPAIGAPLAADLIRVAALQPGERVLDVACGTGIAARLAAQQVGPAGTVAGLDINGGMLAVASAAAPPDLSIKWHNSSAETIPLPDNAIDVVLSQMGLQFMPDQKAVLREIHRVLTPDGRLILNVPGPTPPLFKIMADALARHVSPQAAGFVHQVFSLHDPAEIQQLVNQSGFQDVSIQTETRQLRLPEPEAFLWQYIHSTPLAMAIATMDNDQRTHLQQDILPKWQPFVITGAMMLQVRNITVTARK